jgi:CHAT domain-containing protein
MVDNPSGDPKELPAKAKNLYQILIAPVESFLDKSQYLCIVPDKALNYVPFQALMSPATGRYLIEDYSLGTAPSATIFVAMGASARAKAERSQEQLLSVGNPHFNRTEFETLPDLRSAAMEAKAVSGLYWKNHLLLHDEATETEVRSEIALSDVVHLAMHYVVNDQMEMLSGFPLTPETSGAQNVTDGFLQAYEIQSLRLTRTRLVILSGCQTATGRQYAGEGAMSAARPFMIAGVPAVVATLWPVDSEASAELMIGFHAHRTRDHLPSAEALRRAQIEMARGDDATYQHPYYWSAFQAIGGFTTY